jgi:hypothetical protein
MPEAAYRASISDPGCWPGPTTGVSGGGGDPLSARVVELDAVELIRLIVLLGGCRLCGAPTLVETADGVDG